ncbi:hypothetical protein [Halomarina pelagica]|uniref:hypothetical protein n=1 Tax=Halomarina pelagica TaxID=2961599 RepID=UPI0020C2C91B|nr:hypothetical protein [Halomarina sp. BND7]
MVVFLIKIGLIVWNVGEFIERVAATSVGRGGVLVPFEVAPRPRYLALTAITPALLFALSIDGLLSLR